EDGIRDRTVTGVQTCALPISIDACESTRPERHSSESRRPDRRHCTASCQCSGWRWSWRRSDTTACRAEYPAGDSWDPGNIEKTRSEERRVGKEGRERV